ncbi:MAG: hypothetical protein RI955_1320, partial [Bacteroidota bacterium]
QDIVDVVGLQKAQLIKKYFESEKTD